MPVQQRTSRYTRYADAIQPSGIRALEALAARRPDLITFGPGRPDDRLFPADALGRAYAETLASWPHHDHPLNYAPTEGLRSLREWLATRHRAWGRACEGENILVTNGSQQAIHLLTRLLVEPGIPCWFRRRHTLAHCRSSRPIGRGSDPSKSSLLRPQGTVLG